MATCGVVDNEGVEIFADKMGVLVARDLAGKHENAVFVADVKSTGLFATDPDLQAAGPHALLENRSQLYERTRSKPARWQALKKRPLFFQPTGRAWL